MFDQLSLPLETDLRLVRIRDTLRDKYGPQRDDMRLDPQSQFVNAMLSSETRDEVSLRVFRMIETKYKPLSALADCNPDDLAEYISEVTRAAVKAKQLIGCVRAIIATRGDFDLSFLKDWTVGAAMAWLRSFNGVGPKIAAATLNFSDLRQRILVVDRHMLRVAQRTGLVPERASFARALDLLMRLVPHRWTADDLYEFHWLVKEQSREACHHGAPDCGACSIAAVCKTGRTSQSRKNEIAGRDNRDRPITL